MFPVLEELSVKSFICGSFCYTDQGTAGYFLEGLHCGHVLVSLLRLHLHNNIEVKLQSPSAIVKHRYCNLIFSDILPH